MSEENIALTNTPAPPRLAILKASPEILVALCTSNIGRKIQFEVAMNALPEDVKVTAISCELLNGRVISITLASESFAEVPEGAEIPVLPTPVIKTIQRTKYNPLVCFECGGELEDRRGLDRTEGYLICHSPACAVRIPAYAWKDFE